jgi:hypothetical protein
LRTLEQVLTAEYNTNMALADAKMAVAEDMRKYASQAIVEGPPVTPVTAVMVQGAKLAIGAVINAAVTVAAPYNK